MTARLSDLAAAANLISYMSPDLAVSEVRLEAEAWDVGDEDLTEVTAMTVRSADRDGAETLATTLHMDPMGAGWSGWVLGPENSRRPLHGCVENDTPTVAGELPFIQVAAALTMLAYRSDADVLDVIVQGTTVLTDARAVAATSVQIVADDLVSARSLASALELAVIASPDELWSGWAAHPVDSPRGVVCTIQTPLSHRVAAPTGPRS